MNHLPSRDADCRLIWVKARRIFGVLMALFTMASCGGSSSPPQAPRVSLSQVSLSFPSLAVGTDKASEMVTISNIGTAPLVIASITLAGSNSSDFQQSSTCGPTVAPKGSCVVTVTFAPTVTGAESADLKVVTNANPSALDIALSGSGVIPMLSLLAGNPGGPGMADGTATAASFESPYSIAVDSSSTVFVADVATSGFRRISASGVVSTILVNAGPPYLCGPVGTLDIIAVDSNDNLIVSEGQCALSPSGTITALAYNGQGLAVDGAGNAYVTDGSVIYKVTPAVASSDMVTAFAGARNVVGSADGTGAQASFNGAEFMTTDTSDNVYVADVGNSTIRKITPLGVVTTLAGTAGVVGSADGLGPAASFQSIGALAADANGNVYVADCHRPAYRSQGVIGILEPADDRRNEASA